MLKRSHGSHPKNKIWGVVNFLVCPYLTEIQSPNKTVKKMVGISEWQIGSYSTLIWTRTATGQSHPQLRVTALSNQGSPCLLLLCENGQLVEGRLRHRRRRLQRRSETLQFQPLLRWREDPCLPWPSHLRSQGKQPFASLPQPPFSLSPCPSFPNYAFCLVLVLF